MKTYPLKTMNIEDATKLQFKIVDQMTQILRGSESISLGDLGVVKDYNQPIRTNKVEQVIANAFDAEACILVRGAGTGAIRSALYATKRENKKILVHEAAIYPTTLTTIDMLGLIPCYANFHDKEQIKKIIKQDNIKQCLIQFTRQKPDDSYDPKEVIEYIKEIDHEINIVSDDNYAACKVYEIGNQCGANLATFSSFKLLGPEGIGVIIGDQKYVDKIRSINYSGGSQVQGYEAMETLRGLVYAPSLLAIQSSVIDELVVRLNNNEIVQVKNAFVANAQSKVLIVELKESIAEELIKKCNALGAAPNPVGAESKYEIAPMIYRVSGTFLKADKNLLHSMIRINPMRSGADTVIRILKKALEE